MTEIVVGVKALVTASRLAKLVRDKLNETGADARMREMWEIDLRSWRVQREQRIDLRLAVLEQQAEDAKVFEDAVAAMLEDIQFLRVQANVAYEAAREATSTRQEMLAKLAAGLSDPNMSLNLKARIERIVRGLDPEDIVALGEVARDGGVFAANVRTDRPVSFYALIAAGCLVADVGEWDVKADVTPLGEEVLKVFSAVGDEDGDA